MTLTQAGLCEGYGGISMAVADVLGAELAWYSEIEPAACKVLTHHHPDLLNHGDITTADWSTVERVDVLTGGWPCQPWSLAGQRKGAADERAIWPHVARAVRDLRPRLVVLENVASIAAAGELARAAGDLAALGYVGSWRRVRASDVGAPHQRARIFICAQTVAHSGDRELAERARSSRREAGQRVSVGAELGRGSSNTAAHPDSVRSIRGGGTRRGRLGSAHSGNPASDADVEGRGAWRGLGGSAGATAVGDDSSAVADWAGYGPAIKRWEHATGRRAPAPTVLGKRGGPQLSARFAEWLMGLPDGHVTAVPGLSRNEQLKLCGNGVVWQQAAHALRLMLAADTGRVAA